MHLSPALESWLLEHADSLHGMLRGLEKESLRIDARGHLARSAHPQGLGSALTHPQITTDYSEALIELITPALPNIEAALQHLDDLHTYVYRHLGEELLWPHSMPCLLGPDDEIPLAQYGSSNSGRMKTLYRQGLGLRYGRRMQTIAGIHYNLSLPESFWIERAAYLHWDAPLQDLKSRDYFHLVRNFQRHSWLLLYLYGASPAVCASFLEGRPHPLQRTSTHTLYLPHATSLRMSDIGYQNSVQANLTVSYNDLKGYIHDLDAAIRTPYPPFEALGICDSEGQRQQISGNILQIENEYYSLIRPKRTVHRGERPSLALHRRGVEYVELRCVDLNPFAERGIDAEAAHFLEVFAVHMLLMDSPCFHTQERVLLSENQRRMVQEGRRPGLRLVAESGEFDARQQALTLMEAMRPVAHALDQAYAETGYSQALAAYRLRLIEPERCWSARILDLILPEQASFFEFGLEVAERTAAHYRQAPLDSAPQQALDALAAASLQQQHDLEQAEPSDLDSYLRRYFEPPLNTRAPEPC